MNNPGVDYQGGSFIFHEFQDAKFCTCTTSEMGMDFARGINAVFAVLVLHVIINDIKVSIKYNIYSTDSHGRNDSFISGALSIEMKN